MAYTGNELRAESEEVGKITREFIKAINTYVDDVEETKSAIHSAIQNQAWEGDANEQFKESVEEILKKMEYNAQELVSLTISLEEKAVLYDELIIKLKEAGYND